MSENESRPGGETGAALKTSATQQLTGTGDVMPLDAAKRIDQRIRLIAGTTADNIVKLLDLLAEAKQGQIHVPLGFASWPAYVADALSQLHIAVDAWTRRALVMVMSDEGMSNRAIAQAVGVSEITVRRDREQVRHDVAPDADPAVPRPTVIGLDGKTYTRPAPKPEPKPAPVIDAEVVDDDVVVPAKANTIWTGLERPYAFIVGIHDGGAEITVEQFGHDTLDEWVIDGEEIWIDAEGISGPEELGDNITPAVAKDLAASLRLAQEAIAAGIVRLDRRANG